MNIALKKTHSCTQMLAELKDLVQKGLFTQVCLVTLDFEFIFTACKA